MESKKLILIVDDSEFVRSYHSYILEQAQSRRLTAATGLKSCIQIHAT